MGFNFIFDAWIFNPIKISISGKELLSVLMFYLRFLLNEKRSDLGMMSLKESKFWADTKATNGTL